MFGGFANMICKFDLIDIYQNTKLKIVTYEDIERHTES